MLRKMLLNILDHKEKFMSLIDESESEYTNSSNNAIRAILMQYLTFYILAFAEATFI